MNDEDNMGISWNDLYFCSFLISNCLINDDEDKFITKSNKTIHDIDENHKTMGKTMGFLF